MLKQIKKFIKQTGAITLYVFKVIIKNTIKFIAFILPKMYITSVSLIKYTKKETKKLIKRCIKRLQNKPTTNF